MRTRLIAVIGLLISFVPAVHAGGSITTVAGGVPNNVPALSVGLSPSGVFRDAAGNLYISSSSTSAVYKVSPSGQLTTVAGNGVFGFTGDGGLATSATLSEPSSVFVDAAGNIFIADAGNNRIREVVASTGYIQAVAGNGTAGFNGDGGLATAAELKDPESVFVDAAGNIFIADSLNNRIREVVASTGNIKTVAGNGLVGFGGDGGLATAAELQDPEAVFVDSAGNIFIADTENSRIREVVASTGDIQTVAGNGLPGYSGDGGPATNAELNYPGGLFVDTAGDIFIGDTANNCIREVVVSTGNIQTVAGNSLPGYSGDGGLASGAELDNPAAVFVDPSGDIFIADADNNRIREIVASTGDIQAVAGNGTLGFSGDGGPATGAELSNPSGLFVDAAGDIFFSDYGNNRIREVVASTGDIQTVGGNGLFGFSEDGGLATATEINYPGGLYVDAAGNIFIADTNNNRIREVVASTGDIQTVAGNGTAGFNGDGGTAVSAELNLPNGVFVDPSENIFIADTVNNRIREVVASTGNIKTVAGNGTAGFSGDGGPAASAELDNPAAVFVDIAGDIFIPDTDNNRVREVVASTGNIQTVAGNGTAGFSGDGGPATSANLSAPKSVFVDTVGDIFISDSNNSRIREVVASTGNIQTVAGNGTAGFSGDGGPATSAGLNSPEGIWGDSQGNLLISDSDNNRIRSFAAFSVPPRCALSATPTKAVTGHTVSVTLACTAPANDSLSGTISWGDGSNPSTTNATATGGSATLSSTHTYATASSPADSISATVTDTTSTLPGTVNPASVAINVFVSPVVTPSQSSVSGSPGQAVNMTMSFAGGAAEAGAVFSTIACNVSPTATCILSPATLTLDSNGNGTLTVTVTPPSKATSLLAPANRMPKIPLLAFLTLLSAFGIASLGVRIFIVQRRGWTAWSLAVLLLVIPVLLTMAACGGGANSGSSSTSTGSSVAYTVNVQAQSAATSQLPSFQASGNFIVTVQYP